MKRLVALLRLRRSPDAERLNIEAQIVRSRADLRRSQTHTQRVLKQRVSQKVSQPSTLLASAAVGFATAAVAQRRRSTLKSVLIPLVSVGTRLFQWQQEQ